MGFNIGKTSKRTPVRLRHKIQKASAAKGRKERKLAKKNPEWRSRVKKDPGIPNLFPFKDKLLQEIEEKKRMKEEEQQRIREEARERRRLEKQQKNQQTGDGQSTMVDDEDLMDDDDEMDADIDDGDSSNPMAALLASAKARAAEYDGQHEDEDDEDMDEDDDEDDDDDDDMEEDQEDGGAAVNTAPAASKESSRRQFDKVFKQVVDAADVVLYVLDARDPEGTRSKEVEREIMSADGGSKRLILILNKIDLVPPQVLKGWMIHLRRYFPTLPLKASNGTANSHSFDHKQLTVKGTSETLFRALKSYAHNKQMKRSVSVGVIGYPNVGKSSVINALTARLNKGSSNACPTGAEAGVTTNLREVKLDGKLKLIDSPGIVFPNMGNSSSSGDKKSNKKKQEDHARLILLNAIPPKQIEDPIPAVNLLLRRLSKSENLMAKLLEVYGIPPLFPAGGQDQTTDFLVNVARKRGRLGKGGVPNIESAAMTVINDWRDGRIQGWANAPTLSVVDTTATGGASAPAAGEGVDTKQIVTEWAEEFKLEGLWGNGEEE